MKTAFSVRCHISASFAPDGHPGLFYAQERTDEIVAYATCAPRGEWGETLPYSIATGTQRKRAAKAAHGALRQDREDFFRKWKGEMVK